jgi:hypothetical protein
VACLAPVEAKSLIISPLVLLRVDLGSVEVHAIYVYCVNILYFAALVAIVIVVSFTQLLHVLLVDHQLVNHLDLSGEVIVVRLGDMAGDLLLQL